WHIPLQAGSDAVLEIMRRGYSAREFEEVTSALQSRFVDPAITTDVIVGHPGESADRFEETLRLSERVGFARIHVFPFSFREGTLSAKLWTRDAVPPAEIRRRVDARTSLEANLGRAYRERWVGKVVDVLIEGGVRGEEGFLQGLTDRYVRVRF